MYTCEKVIPDWIGSIKDPQVDTPQASADAAVDVATSFRSVSRSSRIAVTFDCEVARSDDSKTLGRSNKQTKIKQMQSVENEQRFSAATGQEEEDDDDERIQNVSRVNLRQYSVVESFATRISGSVT
jgi:hypothetical protein